MSDSSSKLFLLEVDCRAPRELQEERLEQLSAEVQERAHRYLVEEARQNLVASQWVLLQILKALRIPIQRLKRCPKGRPYLEGQSLEFNLSHSADRAVFAFANTGELRECLGVDVEYIHRNCNTVALAKRFFHS